MKYVVLEMFGDAEDSNRTYMPGDIYPIVGLEVSEERIKELSTDANRRGRPVIKALEEEPVEVAEVEETTEEISEVEEPVEEPIEEPIEEPVEEPVEETLEEDEPGTKRRRKRSKGE